MAARILAVHDREKSQVDIKNTLEPMHVVTVCDAIERVKIKIAEFATTSNHEKPFDLILCAVHLSDDKNGNVIDFLKWIRADERTKEVPFLLICTRHGLLMGEFCQGLRSASSALGAAGFLMVDDLSNSKFLQSIESYLPKALKSASSVSALHAETLIPTS